MGDIVQCGIVKKDHVLIGAASAHMKTAAPFRGSLYPRKHLYHFKQIHFSKQRGDTLNDLGVYALNAHLGPAEPFCRTIGKDGHTLYVIRHGHESEYSVLVAVYGYFCQLCFISDIGNLKPVISLRKLDQKVAPGICKCPKTTLSG